MRVEIVVNGSHGLEMECTGWWRGFLLAFADENGHA